MYQNVYNTLSRKYICVYIRISLQSYPSKFIELVSLKVHMYTHAELKPKLTTYQKSEPHQMMLIELASTESWQPYCLDNVAFTTTDRNYMLTMCIL